MSVLDNLEPKKVFHYFEEICNIPHGSRNTRQISDYLVHFAKEHHLEYFQDELNNVIMIKEASAGYEHAEPVIIQGHMDMVCEKEKGCDIDFEKEGLRLYVDDDFVKAKDTTLGGDDGIAVAYALAILDSEEIAHPRLEVVITVDEEIGMLGAYDIDLSMLKGHQMLNLDSDEEGHFLTSCAGGMSLIAQLPIARTEQTGCKLALTITGLEGGHSGSEIHKEHGNADILMGRLLKLIMDATPLGIISLAGGLKDNAIPRECNCEILVPEENKEIVADLIAAFNKTLKKEYAVSDAKVEVLFKEEGTSTEQILSFGSVHKLIFFLRTVPNGVQHMSMIMPGLVETSLNLGIMNLKEDALDTVISIRSSVSSRKEDLKDQVTQIVEMLGGEVTIEGDYPAWEYKAESKMRETIAEIYREQYGKEAVFEAIHAGLECGIFSDKIKDLDCVSFGPMNLDIHTPKERLSISSTERIWRLIIEYLKQAK